MGKERGTPVQPGEARAHGNAPDAVEVHRGGGRGTGAEDGGARTGAGRAETPQVATGDRAYAAPVVHRASEETRDAGRIARRDSTRWGPIWAGLITAITTFLLLQLLAIGLGLVGIGPDNVGGGGWVPAIIGLIAFFTGGSVAGMTSAVRGSGTGLLNGFLVWALGTVLILLLSALGLGQIFGALGGVVGQLGLLQPGGLNVPNNPNVNVDPSQIAQAVRTGAIAAFFGLAVSALASMLGGLLGSRSDDPIGRTADRD